MADDLSEKLERLCERFGVPEPWKTLMLRRMEDGRSRYGPWNHLAIAGDPERLFRETAEEGADFLALLLFFPWSGAYHSTQVRSPEGLRSIGMAEEDADEAVDSDIVEGLIDVLRLLSGATNGKVVFEQ